MCLAGWMQDTSDTEIRLCWLLADLNGNALDRFDLSRVPGDDRRQVGRTPSNEIADC